MDLPCKKYCPSKLDFIFLGWGREVFGGSAGVLKPVSCCFLWGVGGGGWQGVNSHSVGVLKPVILYIYIYFFLGGGGSGFFF